MKRLMLLGCLIALCLSACSFGASEDAVQTAIAETEAAVPTATEVFVTSTPSQTSTETAEPTPTKTLTSTPSDADWIVENARVTDLRFFESGYDVPNFEEREYSDQFTVKKARYINWEVQFDCPSLEERKDFIIRSVYYRNGNWFGEVDLDSYIKPEWDQSNHAMGYGWREPGNWPNGEFRVDLHVGGEKIASDSFHVYLFTPTPEATATSTPRPGAIVDTDSLNVRGGPDTVYGIVTGVSEGDHLEIVGEAYDCAWLKIETEDGVVGWVSAALVDYDLSCSDIPSASIPPTPVPPPPTDTPKPAQPTKAPSGKTVKVRIVNNTGGGLSLHLQGPASYQFNFGAGTHTINVVPGNYTYTAWGCGTSASGSKKLNAGSEWEWYCE